MADGTPEPVDTHKLNCTCTHNQDPTKQLMPPQVGIEATNQFWYHYFEEEGKMVASEKRYRQPADFARAVFAGVPFAEGTAVPKGWEKKAWKLVLHKVVPCHW